MADSRFQVHNIDPIYINSAIREMNQETATGFRDLYRHIEEWRTYGGAILDMLRVREIEQDVIDNIIAHTPQLVLPTMPQILPVDEGRAKKKRKATIRNTDQQLIQDMSNSVAYDTVDAPTIHKPASQMNYDLPTLQQVLEAGVLSLSCVERYQLTIYSTLVNGFCLLDKLSILQRNQETLSFGVIILLIGWKSDAESRSQKPMSI